MNSNIKRLSKISLKLSTKPLILSAGMPRSGSTLLFNILREISLQKWPDLSYGWEGDILELSKGTAYLVKVHRINRYYRLRTQYSFYTYRDVRVTAVSSMRKFGVEPNIDNFRSNINEYMIAKRHCNLILKYENLISNPISGIEKIAEKLGVKIDQQVVFENTFFLKAPVNISNSYSKETLLHKEHFTHTKDDDWRTVLSKELQEEVNSEFSWWFNECGYPLR